MIPRDSITVAEVIEALKQCDPASEVWMQMEDGDGYESEKLVRWVDVSEGTAMLTNRKTDEEEAAERLRQQEASRKFRADRDAAIEREIEKRVQERLGQLGMNI